MGSFHSVAAPYRHSEGSGAEVVSRSYCGGGIGSVMIIDIHFVIALRFFRIIDKAVGEFVIIGCGGVFSADGNGVFVAVITGTDKADVDGDIFGNLRRNIGAAHADFLGIGERKDRSVFRFKVVFGEVFEHCENAGNCAFVVDEAGFDISVFGHLASGVNGNKISVADSKGFYVLLAGNFFIKDDHHCVLIPGKGSCVVKNVNGMALACEKTGIFPSVTGVDCNGFALIAVIADSAELTDADHAVLINGADDHSESIGMRTDQNGFGIILTFKCDISGAFVVIGHLLTEFCGIFFKNRVHLYVIAHGARYVYNILKAIDNEFFVNIEFHCFFSFRIFIYPL